MNGKYVGYVAGHDPLHGFLSKIIRECMNVHEPGPAFRAFQLSGSNVVYAYEEKFSGVKIICKFYGPKFAPDCDKAGWKAREEYERLKTLRGYQLIGSPHHMIRPLGFSRDINGVLAVEYYSGEEFSHAITRATYHRDDAHLTYQGIDLGRVEVRDLYFRIMSEQQDASPEEHPEFDAAGIWRSIINTHKTAFTRALSRAKLNQMPLFLAEMCRGISRHRLGLYPHAREVLDALRDRYPLALVTDAQSTYARGELHRVGLLGYFNPIVISGDHGYRKPDRRLFQLALDGMAVAAENTLYVGNDMHRDIFGAQEAGLKTVLFDSDQGKKAYRDCAPDYTITDLRDLLGILEI